MYKATEDVNTPYHPHPVPVHIISKFRYSPTFITVSYLIVCNRLDSRLEPNCYKVISASSKFQTD